MIPNEFAIYIEGRIKFIEEEEKRNRWRNAHLSSVIANFAPKSKRGKIYKPKDFMPKERQTNEDMFNEVKRLNSLFGGEDKRKE